MTYVLVSDREVWRHARATVSGLRDLVDARRLVVVDADATYQPSGAEVVLTPSTLGLTTRQAHRLLLREGAGALRRRLLAAALRSPAVLTAGQPAVLLAAGVIPLTPLDRLIDEAQQSGLVLVGRTAGPTADALHPDQADLERLGAHASSLLAARDDLLPQVASALDRAGQDDRWVDVLAAQVPHVEIRDPATVLSAWNLSARHEVTSAPLRVDGRPVDAVDLSGMDLADPVLLDRSVPGEPRARLSDHPRLACWIAEVCSAARAAAVDEPDALRTILGSPPDPVVGAVYAGTGDDAPDLLDPAEAEAGLRWLREPVGDPRITRYVAALRSTRADLQRAYPRVPGPDTDGFCTWVSTYAAAEGYPGQALIPGPQPAPARPPARRVPGVTVVGFMRGELGIGESARLLVAALDATATTVAIRSVDEFGRSRMNAPDPAVRGSNHLLDTTIVCVNSDLTPAVVAALGEDADRTYRIGMWYWEVEEFPSSQHGGFAAVDEVWVATDFVRQSIEPHSPVPVRTLTPPLPQAGSPPPLDRAALSIPPGPFLLFSFDHLSTLSRKNPLGVIAAYGAAFPLGDGPALVIKSINADQCPADAERVRIAASRVRGVIVVERYLDAPQRDALVNECAAYVSLHRSEGLGLTMAEAMAYGRPVVATGYSGNLQFMTEENSFLVPWTAGEVPAGAEPYPIGSRWAEPDLDAAAALMRRVVADPTEARRRGARAAADLTTKHDVLTAGRAIAARLAELEPARTARSRSASRGRLATRLREAMPRLLV